MSTVKETAWHSALDVGFDSSNNIGPQRVRVASRSRRSKSMSQTDDKLASNERVVQNLQMLVDLEDEKEAIKPIKRRATRKRSKVWDHFDSFTNEKGENKSTCRYCGKEYFSSTRIHGTSALLGHLKVCASYPQNKPSNQTQLAFQTGDVNENKPNLIAWKFDQQAIRKALCHMIIVDELAFKFVERQGFKHFINVCQPSFQIPSRITVTRDCYQLYLEEKKKVRAQIQENVGRICFTTDTWTSLQKVNYMCVTAHFVDNDWRLQKRVLSFSPVLSHRGNDIGKALEMCLLEWGIDNVFTITVDNASSNDVAITYLKEKFANWEKCILGGKWTHIRCVAHIMNLIVQDGLNHIGESVERVRAAVKYVRQSPARIKSFKSFAEIEKCCSTKNLVLDVPTRWNSTYLMLETTQAYERAFSRFDAENLHFREDLENTGVPRIADWKNVRRLIGFLEHFYDLTLKVSGTKYVTAHSFLDDITCIAVVLKKCLNEADDVGLKDMAKFMKSKFDKYYGVIEKMNMLVVVASVLDPRNKFEYLEVLFTDVYGKVDGSSIVQIVKESMNDLYDEYMRIHAPHNTTHSSTYDHSSSSSSLGKRVSPVDIEPAKILKEKFRNEMKRRKIESGVRDSKSELDKYLKEETEVDSVQFDILNWWKVNSPRFPILSLMARDIMAIPISSVASESVFSTGGRVLDAFRSSLTPKIVQTLICMQDWLRASSTPIDIEEIWEDLQQIEEEEGTAGNVT
ncbi:zinc finger BED domain-containing protein RICESLEEPER 2-like isoform X2 [Zingiber officinale]|uniref:zinc finger BED domain-containing protein RICESLEEPER 2-like isoform X2 n=1 Tax=Zingiber officinale TaxID=94328 RepID=UPI001C4B24DB|nr:zinc finger BED domain-containing protein RICESLEEPER 2-like isoform X2 [Zingiber officinale]